MEPVTGKKIYFSFRKLTFINQKDDFLQQLGNKRQILYSFKIKYN